MDFNQAVITTRFVLENNSKIVYVSRDEEGWGFYGAEKNIQEADARVTSLSNIIKLAPHVQEILWISEGMEAWINDDKHGWQTGISKLL